MLQLQAGGRIMGPPSLRSVVLPGLVDPAVPLEPSAEAKANKTRTRWCRAERRCDQCLQTGHFRADCPDSASEAERQQALNEFSAWLKHDAKGKTPAKKGFRK